MNKPESPEESQQSQPQQSEFAFKTPQKQDCLRVAFESPETPNLQPARSPVYASWELFQTSYPVVSRNTSQQVCARLTKLESEFGLMQDRQRHAQVNIAECRQLINRIIQEVNDGSQSLTKLKADFTELRQAWAQVEADKFLTSLSYASTEDVKALQSQVQQFLSCTDDVLMALSRQTDISLATFEIHERFKSIAKVLDIEPGQVGGLTVNPSTKALIKTDQMRITRWAIEIKNKILSRSAKRAKPST